MSTLKTSVLGIEFENPFMLASAPPTASVESIDKAFEMGWGGAVIKTITSGNLEMSDVSPRYATLKSKDKIIGFQNIELLSHKTVQYWCDGINYLKKKHPTKVIIASIMAPVVRKESQKIVNLLYEKNQNLNFLCLNPELTVINTDKNKTIWYNNLEYQQTKCDFDAYINILKNRTSAFKDIISKYKDVMVVSYLEEQFSSKTLLQVIPYLNKIKQKHTVYAIKPSVVYSGQKAFIRATKTLEDISNLKTSKNGARYTLGKNLFIYDSDEIKKENPDSISNANTLIKEKASKILAILLDLGID